MVADQTLTQQGYRVLEAATAAEALERRRDGVDLTLLDYRLPDSDDLSVLKKMKKADPRLILLTGHSGVDTAVEAMKQGAYVVRPRVGATAITQYSVPPVQVPTRDRWNACG